MQVASPLKMIYIILNSRLIFLTHFRLENATAAMFCILKDGIYRKPDYIFGIIESKYSHILEWNYVKNSNNVCWTCLKHL